MSGVNVTLLTCAVFGVMVVVVCARLCTCMYACVWTVEFALFCFYDLNGSLLLLLSITTCGVLTWM